MILYPYYLKKQKKKDEKKEENKYEKYEENKDVKGKGKTLTIIEQVVYKYTVL